MRESMKMMGLKDFPYWMSWFTYHTIITTVLSVIIFMMLYFSNAISISSPTILFLVPFTFGMSVFGVMIVAQSFFESARIAAIVTTFLYLGSAVISELVDVPLYSTQTKLIGSLSPPVAMLFTVRTLTSYESAQIGVTFDNIWAEYENVSVAHGLLMMVLDFFILTFVGLYLDNTLPRTIGNRRSICFCIMPSYWCGSKKSGKIK